CEGLMMNNVLVLPMAIPLLIGIALMFFRHSIILQRWMSFSVMILNVGVSIYLLNRVQAEGVFHLAFGGWEAPYGIVFVADSFSLILVLTASVVTTVCLLYAFFSTDKSHERMFF